MSTIPQQLLTPEEYLARERDSQFKSEYFRGETFSMAGASREHNLIVANIVRAAGNLLEEQSCEVYPGDMRVKVSATGLYTYPDATIVCGEPQFEDDELDTLLNPTVVFEVLSESTEAYDRGTKSIHYRQLPSLKALVLIAQDKPQVEVYVRGLDGDWVLREANEIGKSIDLPPLQIALPLHDIYRRISFHAREE
jgi:Uma2 family endonuclease